jgi:hypothetical protein
MFRLAENWATRIADTDQFPKAEFASANKREIDERLLFFPATAEAER